MKAVLTYHSIDGTESPISVRAAEFARQLAGLRHAGVRIMDLRELERTEEPGHAVAITFDDGFRNFEEDAWPILREAEAPVTVFVASDHVGGTNAWSAGDRRVPELPLMDWAALGRLADVGVSLGGHTRSHPDLRGLPAERVRDELEGSAARIEQETGRRPEDFAYPFGWWDAAAVAAVRRTYGRAYTTELRPLAVAEDRHLLPRIDAYYLRGRSLEQWGSPRFERYLAVRGGLRRVRRLMTEGNWS